MKCAKVMLILTNKSSTRSHMLKTHELQFFFCGISLFLSDRTENRYRQNTRCTQKPLCTKFHGNLLSGTGLHKGQTKKHSFIYI